MNWLFFALAAPAVYTSVVFIDKYIVSKQLKDPQCMPIYATIMGLVGGSFIWAITGFPILSPKDTFVMLLTGVLTVFSFVAYYKAISFEDASYINMLFQMFPILVLTLAYLFLNEPISAKQLIGFVIIFAAVLAASVKISDLHQIRLSKAFFLILLYDILLATSALLIKYSINDSSFSNIISYQSFGVGIGGIFLAIVSPSIRKSFTSSWQTLKKQTIGAMFFNEALFIVGRSLTYFAFSIGPIALVSVLEGTGVFYGIIFALILTLLLPSILKEDISGRILVSKLILGILLVFGVWLVY